MSNNFTKKKLAVIHRTFDTRLLLEKPKHKEAFRTFLYVWKNQQKKVLSRMISWKQNGHHSENFRYIYSFWKITHYYLATFKWFHGKNREASSELSIRIFFLEKPANNLVLSRHVFHLSNNFTEKISNNSANYVKPAKKHGEILRNL